MPAHFFVTVMVKAFTQLERVLSLEKSQGYKNTAVVGGIRQFAAFWVSKARGEALDEADRALIEQIAEVLQGYARLPGLEARAETIEMLQERLRQRESRLAGAVAGPPPSREPALPARPAAAAAPPKRQPEPARQPAPAPASQPITPQEPNPEGLKQRLTALPGVGPATAERLAALGVQTIHELLYLFPRRYDDYSQLKPINRLQVGETVTVIGSIWETRARRSRNNQPIVQAVISDGTGKIQATWFNQPWLAKQLPAGKRIVLSGVVDQYLGRPVFNSPEWEELAEELMHTGRIVPVYPLTKGLTANKMRDLMKRTVEQWAPRVPDPLPESVRSRQQMLPLYQALLQAHFPDNNEMLVAARRRLAFDELFLLQLGMLGQRRTWQAEPAPPLPAAPEALQQFVASLPFALTAAQERVIAEITADMAQPVPMNRLLQGDVGAGKTVVAAAAMVTAVANGAQAAMMAPTEILAEQHYQGLASLLAPLGISVRLLTGSTSAGEREQIYAGLTDGSVQLVIGTHALIQDTVQFHRLGLAVIDEQHRFGVDQRAALRDKGNPANNGRGEARNPHLLVMSATPIPRSLALSMYGDLDLSILDEMPPGRQEIRTRWIRPSERERAYAFVRGQVQQGRQAYFICPLVEESEKIEAVAAVEEHARLQQQVFPDLRLGLVHGRLSSAEKEAAMRAFYGGETDILVSTSVIEVGVDVPNSTVMVIEGANRFGLAQLHQFRGRVGRGEHQSYCLLVSDAASADAEERLQALEQTNDGFELAEKDLEIRGPGEFFGRRQSGMPELRLASLLDVKLLERARSEAQTLFAADAELEQPEHEALREEVAVFWQEAGHIS